MSGIYGNRERETVQANIYAAHAHQSAATMPQHSTDGLIENQSEIIKTMIDTADMLEQVMQRIRGSVPSVGNCAENAEITVMHQVRTMRELGFDINNTVRQLKELI